MQRRPRDDSREASEKKPDIPQTNMNILVIRNLRRASPAPLNVFFRWIDWLKM